MTQEIARLIAELDDDSVDVAESAKASLMFIGAEAIGPLAAALGSLGGYGQLSAIEVFEKVRDPAAGRALIDLLASENDTVREWATWAVAELGVVEAVPMLRIAYQRRRAGGNAVDPLEAVALRYALTALGARPEVLPPLSASLRTSVNGMTCVWPSDRLADVINDLADHDQAVLYFRLWAAIDGHMLWNGHERLDRTWNLAGPWSQIVAYARESALIEAAFVMPRPNLFAAVEWIDHTDA